MTTTKMETTEEEANNKSFSRVKELRSMFEESLTMCFEVKTIGVRLLLILFCILNFFVFFFPRVIACDVTLTFVACALSLSLSRDEQTNNHSGIRGVLPDLAERVPRPAVRFILATLRIHQRKIEGGIRANFKGRVVGNQAESDRRRVRRSRDRHECESKFDRGDRGGYGVESGRSGGSGEGGEGGCEEKGVDFIGGGVREGTRRRGGTRTDFRGEEKRGANGRWESWESAKRVGRGERREFAVGGEAGIRESMRFLERRSVSRSRRTVVSVPLLCTIIHIF